MVPYAIQAVQTSLESTQHGLVKKAAFSHNRGYKHNSKFYFNARYAFLSCQVDPGN